MAEIAREAGISYGLVYHYYKNKADLFDAILDDWWAGLYAMMENDLPAAESVEGKLRAIIDYFVDQYEQNPDLVHIFIMEVSRSTANLTPPRLDTFRTFIRRTEKIIADAQSAGKLRADIKARYLSTFFLGALETMISTMVLNNQTIKGEAQKARIADYLLASFFDGARLGKRRRK